MTRNNPNYVLSMSKFLSGSLSSRLNKDIKLIESLWIRLSQVLILYRPLIYYSAMKVRRVVKLTEFVAAGHWADMLRMQTRD